MKKYKILVHEEANNFIESLEHKRKARIDRIFDLFEEYGLQLPRRYLKKVTNLLWELRPGDVRLFLGIEGKKGIVVHGIRKKTKKLPKKDINLSKRRIQEYLK